MYCDLGKQTNTLYVNVNMYLFFSSSAPWEPKQGECVISIQLLTVMISTMQRPSPFTVWSEALTILGAIASLTH